MISAEVEQQIRGIVEDQDYILWACEYIPQGKHSMLRIYIDKQEGIGISDCESVSRSISAWLDVEEPVKGNYLLEVSSPGIPRPLFTVEHYKQYLHHIVDLKLIKPVVNRKKLSGEIIAVKGDDIIVLRVENEEHDIPFSLIVKASLNGE